MLVSIPANPVPEGAVSGSIRTADGVTLRYARFAPPPGRRGTVCIFQGRSEFIEKYYETVRDLRRRGFAVAAFDWRGQGGSERLIPREPRKGHVRRFDDYLLDLDAFVRQVVLPDCPPPFYALGHSMGAMNLLRAAHNGMHWFERIVMSAPMLGLQNIRLPALSRGVVKALRLAGLGESYVPRRDASLLQSAPFPGNPLTSDPVRYARNAAVLEAAPHLAVGWPTVAWTDGAFAAVAEAAEARFSAQIRQPILMIGAGEDRVVSTAATEAFAARLRLGSYLMVPGARHELLMEQDHLRAQFWAAFDAFVPGTSLPRRQAGAVQVSR